MWLVSPDKGNENSTAQRSKMLGEKETN
jgi:hypothetical protein